MLRLVAKFAAASCIFLEVSSAHAEDIKRVTANGTELAYVEVGQGEPVIFVHGGLQDYRMWLQHLPKFADRYRAIAYSRRNHFPNEASPESMPDGAADAHGEDLAAFVRALGLSKVRVVAHSSGAHAALFFAAVHPEKLVSLTLNEPPATGILAGVPGLGDMLKEWGNAQAPAREAVKAGDVKTGIPLFVNAVGGPGAYERRSIADQKMNFDNVASFQADATTKRPRPAFTCEMAKSINAPTLLSNGERSPKFFYRIVDQLETCLPNRERIIIAGSSHTVPAEAPDAYDQAVLTFIGKH
ncbi:alpha/beta hydrolase [Bradyrhizobium sp. 180]|uniref:alpha/beta fold hydrolase n=1 Tax=unclassified Bradyrhizobium TaxID=2631580 RepID=UPI001FF9B31F|nr:MULTISPECIES: alpha/beta hydrolase [unclassified Bradyrhizobium]MCK1420556.1 alpha/beta hydrolase [Bradyrhizobium sp. CW12]MCK1494572.1 alpha/beta hydrolase [Bradyrhizobium sp. 180]MCK1527014.1 alpha/beta hydrolase [Bradyrhizobium sp. 182]MCK1595438.1 alpha/beta hydrolase [Bradyrhizobium sp. 164]MCK1620355.1 alpha/beta hydrolase [Bradyrhizobium sp. 159]